MNNIKKFWKQGKGKFYKKEKFLDTTMLFNLLLVKEGVRKGIKFFKPEKSIKDITRVYPFIFNYQHFKNPENNNYIETIVYCKYKPEPISIEDLKDKRSYTKYIDRQLGNFYPGGMVCDYPNQEKIVYHYQLMMNNKVIGFHSQITKEEVDDSEYLRRMSEILSKLDDVGEVYTIRTNKTKFIPSSDNWLASLYWSFNAKENFIRFGTDNEIPKNLIEELYDAYRYNVSFGYTQYKLELYRKINFLYPGFFIFEQVKENEFIISRSKRIKVSYYDNPCQKFEEEFQLLNI